MGEDRIVLPIPPGMRWDDELPVLLPQESAAPRQLSVVKEKGGAAARAKLGPQKPTVRPRAGIQFSAPSAKPVPVVVELPKPEPEVIAPVPKVKKPKRKADPKLIAAARELRDRWLERVNAGAYVFEDAGKYDVARALPDVEAKPVRLLPRNAA